MRGTDDPDKALAQMLVEQGFASSEHVQECLALPLELRASGAEPLPKLGELLLRKGYVNRAAYEQTVKMGQGRTRGGTAVEILEDVRAALADPANDLGKFVRVSLLGRGGMGEVWKAWEKDLGRWVAIKFVRGHDPEDEKRFLREAQFVARLQHPNIAQVYEIGMHEGRPFLAMQLVPGTTIDRGKLDLRQKLKAIRDVATALHYAHQQAIVHRDLKPSNIMMESEHVFLMDFGLARQTQVDSSVSQSGMVVGTPQYMSPEQAKGHAKLVDARSDVYSLGATLYALLCGRPPHQEEDLLALLQKVASEEAIAPRKIDPQLPWEVETIVLKAMEKERERRYQTAMELAEDIQRYLDDEPIRAKQASVTYRIKKKLSKHRWVAGLTAAVMLLGLGFAGYVLAAGALKAAQKSRDLKEAQGHEGAARWSEAQAAYERAHALDREDGWVRRKKEEMARKVQEEKQRLETGNAQKEAALAYEAARRELDTLRLKTYQKNFSLMDKDFARFEELRANCEERLRRVGDSAEGWWAVGMVLEVLGRSTEAEEAYRKGLRVNHEHGGCVLYLGRLLIWRALEQRFRSSGDKEGAGRDAQEALDLMQRGAGSGALSEVERDLAAGYREVVLGKQDRTFYDNLIGRWQGKEYGEEFYLVRGLAFWDLLIEDASRAIALRPSFAEAFFWRGAARHNKEDRDGAIEDHTRAIEVNPKLAEAFYNRGVARQAKGDLDGAIKDWTKAIEINPKFAEAFNNRGLARQAQGNLDGAIEDYARAIEVNPKFAEAFNNRGVAREALARREPKRAKEHLAFAAKDLDTALQVAPANWRYRNLAESVLRRVREALAKLEKEF